jgi:hypothetical protein
MVFMTGRIKFTGRGSVSQPQQAPSSRSARLSSVHRGTRRVLHYGHPGRPLEQAPFLDAGGVSKATCAFHVRDVFEWLQRRLRGSEKYREYPVVGRS